MKAQKFNRLFLAGLFIFFGIAAIAQPSWIVNPNEYVYSMTITGEITADGYLSMDENDMIAAFVDGECRGVTHVKYMSAVDAYYVFLMVYSNDPTGTVTFKIYDSGTGTEFNVKQSMDFTVNGIYGSASKPFLFSADVLNSGDEMLTFAVPNQEGETAISGTDVVLEEHWSGQLTALAATFTVSGGAKVYVNGVEQQSGVTVNDFSSPVEYTVQSADRTTTTVYTVYVTFSLSEAKLLEFTIPNQVGGTWISGNDVSLQEHWSGDLTSIAPTFTLSDGATAYVNGVEQVSGVTVHDFSSPVEYRVESAQDSRVTIYTVDISYLIGEANILSFSIPNQEGATTISGTDIALQEHWSGDLTSIAPSFTLSDGAKVFVNGVEQVSGVTVNNFLSPVEYTVESARGVVIKTFTVEIIYSPSEGDLLSFTIPNQVGATSFSGNNVSLQEHWSGDLTSIAPSFTLSPGATVYVNGVEQVSGVTVNDFTEPVEYRVESVHQSVITTYQVEIVYSPSEANLLSFSIPDQQSTTLISGSNVYLQEQWTLNLTDIAANFAISDGATAYINGVEQVSGVTLNDFVDPVQYTIESAHQSVIKTYTVQVLFTDSEAKILAFTIPNEEGTTQINDTIITLKEHWSGDLTQIAANFVLSEGAKAFVNGVEQESGVTVNNFSSPVEYTIESAQGKKSTIYSVEISYSESEGKLLAFSIPNQVGETSITGNNVVLQEHWSGDLTGIAPVFTLSPGAKAYVNGLEQVSGVTTNDFLTPVEYRIESARQMEIETYTVQITTFNDIPTDIFLSTNKKEENSEMTFVGTFSVETDNPDEVHVFSLVDEDDTENYFFSIEGKILRVKYPFNFEEKESYRIKVKADDQKGGVVEKVFDIEVLDVNDAPSNMALINTNTPVNVPVNQIIGQLVVVDEDPADTHTFSLVSGDGTNDSDNSKFYIEGDRLKNSMALSFLEGSEYRIFVQVEDNGGATLSVPLVIRTDDHGNPPHNLTLSNTIVIGIESPPLFVGLLEAADVDQQEGHVFSFVENSELGADNGDFIIVNNTLYLNTPQPVIEKGSYDIFLAATDSMDNEFTRAFTIIVREELGEGGFFLSNINLPENAPFNTIVGFFDSDVFESSEYTFSLPLEVDLNTYCNNAFNFNGRTLLSNRVFDFEEKSDWLIQVNVSDGSKNITQNVVIHIIDQNDSPTGISTSTQVVSEATGVNSIVATLDVEDQDVGDTHTFSLAIGNGINDEGNSMFKIVGNNLILAKPLDFEVKEFHNILLRVTDSKGATFEQGMRLRVIDANDAPEFISTPVNYVLQNQVFVYAIEVIDSENDPISFDFSGLPTWLSYNPTSNLISGVAGNELVGDYNFSIIASDGKSTAVQEFVLTVINVNDPPEINYYLGKQHFFSEQSNDINLPSDCIIDPDVGDELTYDLSMENKSAMLSWIQFDPSTLKVSGTPPKEACGTYKLKLTATDKGKLKEWLVFDLEVAIPTVIGDVDDSRIFRVYPNPVKDQLQVSVPQDINDAQISIVNIAGQTIKTFVFNSGTIRNIPFNEVTPGVYFVKLKQGSRYEVEKIVKE